MAVQSR